MRPRQHKEVTEARRKPVPHEGATVRAARSQCERESDPMVGMPQATKTDQLSAVL
jgi:hypothetical protein